MIYKSAKQGQNIQQKDYSKDILLSLDDFKDKKHLLQVVTIPPRTKQRLHFHKTQTEVYYVLEGEAIISINGEEVVARPEDVFVCEAREKHFVWNKMNNDFKLIVFKIDYPKEDDTVWFEE